MFDRIVAKLDKTNLAEKFFFGAGNTNLLPNFKYELIHWEDTEDEWSGPVYRVYKFTDELSNEECFVKFNGHYRSHCGSEFSHVSECKVKVVTRVVYE